MIPLYGRSSPLEGSKDLPDMIKMAQNFYWDWRTHAALKNPQQLHERMWELQFWCYIEFDLKKLTKVQGAWGISLKLARRKNDKSFFPLLPLIIRIYFFKLMSSGNYSIYTRNTKDGIPAWNCISDAKPLFLENIPFPIKITLGFFILGRILLTQPMSFG